MTGVIYDCDPGHDDAIALLLALGSPAEIDLLGVTTVAGNQTLEKTTANAIRVLDHVGRADVVVAAGAARPLVREPEPPSGRHGETGLDGPDLPAPSREPASEHAIELIARTLAAAAEPITLVPTGPLTNIGLLLARYPELQPAIERIVLMGGAVGLGNATPAAETNIWIDPEAAARVFQSDIDVTMVGIDVTYQALMTPAHAERLAVAGRAGRLVADLYAFYSRVHLDDYGWQGAPVHDAVAMAHVIDPSLLQTQLCGVRVDTGPEISRGRTYVDVRGLMAWEPKHRVAVGIDSERFLALLIERIEGLR